MTPITVGTATGRTGEKVSGFIPVPDAADPGTSIPVTVITGPTEGPVLALTAGIHGSEPAPIVALQRVRADVDPTQVAGTLILVHIANVPSFTHRTIYRGPHDQKNLNRVFPGRPDGTTSERIAHAITTHVIDQCDYLVDMHSGDGNEALRPYAYWNQLGLDEQVDSKARDLALAFGLDYIVIDRARPRDASASQFCSNTAHVRGKPSITTEAGSVGIPSQFTITLNVRGAMRVMRFLGMIPGEPQLVDKPKWIDPSEVLTSPDTGTWHNAVEPGQEVKTGDLIGKLTNYFGEPITEIMSPMDGIIMYVVASPAMGKGEPVAMVGQIRRD